MKKHTEEGGIACGLCSISLQQASLGFGIADITHGILGIAVITSMIIKKENDVIHYEKEPEKLKMTGYTAFVKNTELWMLHFALATFVLQTLLAMILCVGASNRSSFLCGIWTIGSVIASPIIPMTYCLLGLGRLFEWATVGEFLMKVENEDLEYQRGMSNGRNGKNGRWKFSGSIPKETEKDDIKILED